MTERGHRLTQGHKGTRGHLWRWESVEVDWERRNLVVGGLSPIGIAVAATTAAASSAGNRRRHRAALNEAAARWRYAASGSAHLLDGQLTIIEESGITRRFDLLAAAVVEEPTTGWISWRLDGGDDAWAVQFMS